MLRGLRDGLPIGAGYFAVAFSLGIIAARAGLCAWEGFLSSLLTRASAGEYGSYALMAAGAGLADVAALCVVANLRYLLMGTALLQKLPPSTPMWKRLAAALCITDEVFAISIAYDKGPVPVRYTAGAMTVAGLMWALGTACGIGAGNILPAVVVEALGVALYGMFIAIIVAPAKRDKAVLLAVLAAFALSCLFKYIPGVAGLSEGVRIVLLSTVISAAAALLKPVEDDSRNADYSAVAAADVEAASCDGPLDGCKTVGADE